MVNPNIAETEPQLYVDTVYALLAQRKGVIYGTSRNNDLLAQHGLRIVEISEAIRKYRRPNEPLEISNYDGRNPLFFYFAKEDDLVAYLNDRSNIRFEANGRKCGINAEATNL